MAPVSGSSLFANRISWLLGCRGITAVRFVATLEPGVNKMLVRWLELAPQCCTMWHGKIQARNGGIVRLIVFVFALSLVAPYRTGAANADGEVRATIQKFYDSFNDGFLGPADYATQDWNHINPSGGRTQGRDATLKRVREVHQTFLKGARETIESIDIRFASGDVAVGTVVSVSSPITLSDGTKHGAQRGIRTFVVVRRGGRWLIMQDHNTTVLTPSR
jgi:uncharacterized protein (TIGR02246 family)